MTAERGSEPGKRQRSCTLRSVTGLQKLEAKNRLSQTTSASAREMPASQGFISFSESGDSL